VNAALVVERRTAGRRVRAPRTSRDEIEELEIQLLLEGIHQRYGCDFREYAYSSLRRRIRQVVQEEGLHTVSALQERLLHHPRTLHRFLDTVCINVTSMFRDPSFYRAFRQRVAPLLRTYPQVRIWHAGCATGEEVYSMAMLLWEEDLYGRSRIYATDMHEAALRKAETGVFPMSALATYRQNYRASGGKASFSRFYTPLDQTSVIVKDEVRRNIVFARHNLVTDSSFNEFHVVLCRNVLIYFNKRLQDRVHGLLYGSLVRLGFLCLGSKETILFTPFERRYEDVDAQERVYRKVA
jgi:chemotaxis protein methyltransferase CheR